MKRLLFILACCGFAKSVLAISEADLASSAQAWSGPKVDSSVDGQPLQVGGERFQRGIGTHAISEIPLSVPKDAVRLKGKVGVDDEVGKGRGSVIFRILSGNAILWESPAMKAGMKALAFELAVPASRYRKLYLQADQVEHNEYDHADWLDLEWTRGEVPELAEPRTFAGSEFGLMPGSDRDQSEALRNALEALRAAPGSTLELEKGVYHFYRENALKRHFHVSNHDQPDWHPVSLPLVDLRNVTIDGKGSRFVFHGQLMPVLVQDSERICLRGLSLDFARPHHSQGRITRIESAFYELEVDPNDYPHEIRNGWFVFQGEAWESHCMAHGIVFDGKTHEIVAGTQDFHFQGEVKPLAIGKYRVQKDLTNSRVKVGDVITMRHSGRPHPGITIYRSKDTVIEDVFIHQAAGMALLAQRSENIRFSGGGVCLAIKSGRLFTSNADATHFSNCRGQVLVEDANFEGMMDDAINVHATCLRIDKVQGKQTLICRYVHPQAVGFETFLPGEKLRFIRAKTLSPGPTIQVKSVRKLSTTEVELSLDGAIPTGIGVGDAVENADWFPEVVFKGNRVRNNRARGTLFTTPKAVLVEDNSFINSSGSAILLAGDANGWYESGACHEVVIRGNRFRNNLTSRYQFTEGIISIYPEVPDLKAQKEAYHRGVLIENNFFETHDVPLLFAISTADLSFRGNRVRYNQDYPAWNKAPFIFRRCERVTIEKNRVENSPRGIWNLEVVSRKLTPAHEVKVK